MTKSCRRVFSLSYSLRFYLSMHISTIFSEALSLALNRTISSIIIDKLLIKGKEKEKLIPQTETRSLKVIKGVIKYILF